MVLSTCMLFVMHYFASAVIYFATIGGMAILGGGASYCWMMVRSTEPCDMPLSACLPVCLSTPQKRLYSLLFLLLLPKSYGR